MNNIDISKKDQYFQTPLHVALSVGDCEIVRKILADYKNIITITNDIEGNYELHKWVSHSCEDCLLILKPYVLNNFSFKNMKENNPLNQAIIENNFGAFKLLFENFEFNMSETAENEHDNLQLCCVYSNIVRIKLILENI